MNKTQLKELVKSHFGLIEKPEVKASEGKFASAVLVDGTQVETEGDFEVGKELYVITEDGSKVIAPIGLHTTESGIAIDVDAEGKIVGIHRPDQEPEGSLAVAQEQQAAAAEPVAMAEEGEVMAEGPEVGDIIEAVIEAVKPEIEMLKQKMADMEEQMKKVFSAPASEKTQASKFGKTEVEEQKIADPINAKMAKMAVEALKAKKK